VTRKGDKINIGIKQRSSIESELMAISDAIEACGHLAGAEIYLYGEYPPWTPSLDSVTLNLVKTVYHELFGEEPKIKAIHAGVECALLGDTFPGMDMVSIGSTVINAHSPDERVLVPSVAKHWKLITAVLDKIGA